MELNGQRNGMWALHSCGHRTPMTDAGNSKCSGFPNPAGHFLTDAYSKVSGSLAAYSCDIAFFFFFLWDGLKRMTLTFWSSCRHLSKAGIIDGVIVPVYAVLGDQPRASGILDKHFTNWPTSSASTSVSSERTRNLPKIIWSIFTP